MDISKLLNICMLVNRLAISGIQTNRSHHPYHVNHCNQIFSIMKYGVNRVTLVGV
jgi:hypothetical protein